MYSAKAWRVVHRQLTDASCDELQTRCRQAAAKRWDVARFRFGAGSNGNLTSLTEGPARFLFMPSDLPRFTALLHKQLPSEGGQLIEEADRICRHRFELLGYQYLNYGPEIDWHLDMVPGKSAQKVHADLPTPTRASSKLKAR